MVIAKARMSMTFCAGCCIRTPSGGNILLARGAFPDDSGTVDLPIGRDEAAPTKRAITPDGQPSRTEYTVLERFPAGARARPPAHGAHAPDPRTWRPSATCSLATLYGSPDDMLSRPALHSAYLSLRHPVTGETLELAAPLPDDLEKMAALCRRKHRPRLPEAPAAGAV